MFTFFSRSLRLYVSQFKKNGTIYFGQGRTASEAIGSCVESVFTYAPYDR